MPKFTITEIARVGRLNEETVRRWYRGREAGDPLRLNTVEENGILCVEPEELIRFTSNEKYKKYAYIPYELKLQQAKAEAAPKSQAGKLATNLTVSSAKLWNRIMEAAEKTEEDQEASRIAELEQTVARLQASLAEKAARQKELEKKLDLLLRQQSDQTEVLRQLNWQMPSRTAVVVRSKKHAAAKKDSDSVPLHKKDFDPHSF